MVRYYKIESIIGHKQVGKRQLFLIKWQGYSRDQATYEPVKNILHQDLIDEYKQKHPASFNKKSLVKKAPLKKAIKKDITQKKVKIVVPKKNVKRSTTKVAVKATKVAVKATKATVKAAKVTVKETGQEIKQLPNPQKDVSTVLSKSNIQVIKNVFKEKGHIYYTVQTKNEVTEYLVGSNQLAKSAKPDLIIKFFENLIK